MVLYADEVFALNFLINLFLLQTADQLTGLGTKKRRLLLSAGFGGAYSVLTLLPPLSFLASLPCRAAALAAMGVLAFGLRRQSLQRTLWFLGVSCGFGGLVFSLCPLLSLGAVKTGGTVYYGVSFFTLVLLAIGIWLISLLVLPRTAQHKGQDILSLGLEADGHRASISALVDTGNTLRDPLTGEGIIVAGWPLARQLLPDMNLTPHALADPAQCVRVLQKAHPAVKPRLVPYRAVGQPMGLLLAVRCTSITVNGKKMPGGIVAFSPTEISDGGMYQALTGGYYAQTDTGRTFTAARLTIPRKNHVHRRQRCTAAASAAAGGKGASGPSV